MASFIRKNLLNLILCLGELVIGILLLVNPEGFTQAIVLAVGIVVAALGVLNVINYFRADPREAAEDHRLAYGLGQLALGVFFLTRSGWTTQRLMETLRLFGIPVLVLALIRVQQFVDAYRLKLPRAGLVSGFTALVTLVFAGILLFGPSTLVFIGIILLVEAIMDILILFLERRTV